MRKSLVLVFWVLLGLAVVIRPDCVQQQQQQTTT